MRKRHFASSAEGPPSRLAKRGSESGSRQQQPEDVPDIPGAAPEERLIYQQMVDSFSVDHRPGGGRSSGGGGAAAGRMWIKAGVVQPGAGEMQLADTRRVYIPQTKYGPTEQSPKQSRSNSPPPSQPPGSSASSSGADKAAALASRPQRKDTVKRKTNLELFKEELKAMQEKREQRKQMMKQEQQPAERRPKSRFEPDQPQVASQPPPRPPSPVRSELSLDPAEIGVSQFEADKDTTNLFLGNLHPEVTERDLMDLFGRFGPLASVKIMWPRTEVERSKKRNCGFVAYMCRRDSERAVDRLRDRDLMGYQMLIGWGKSVPIPTYPIYVPPMLQAAIDPPPVSGLPFNAQPKEWMAGDIVQQRDAKRTPIDLSTMSSSEQEKLISEAIVKVTVPADRSLLSVINRMVEHVVREGPLFELLVCQRESDNPRYRFLFDYNSASTCTTAGASTQSCMATRRTTGAWPISACTKAAPGGGHRQSTSSPPACRPSSSTNPACRPTPALATAGGRLRPAAATGQTGSGATARLPIRPQPTTKTSRTSWPRQGGCTIPASGRCLSTAEPS
ncbi:hypothetical protein BOX15_Mlig019567g3 [Macrostomum lignano]|uniref:RRM domain-containing protein n=1 Tax=Macrostomum lignano TaxID=282301 RepID=A0A267DIG6_9PLAT|nr:hypothetical protein BOX15_Mlig019567g3 [Macrostomum lignano]